MIAIPDSIGSRKLNNHSRYKCSDPRKYIKLKTFTGDPTPDIDVACKWNTKWTHEPSDFECISEFCNQ